MGLLLRFTRLTRMSHLIEDVPGFPVNYLSVIDSMTVQSVHLWGGSADSGLFGRGRLNANAGCALAGLALRFAQVR